ncbi:hypothetical protein EX895_001622 [Sporisorium graminicola]|uniref:CCZ1/INTU/HSP4 first Longin domain-containing protein n=1 Tax=Sporisorium graminicola TaxID=280036 RepID=A0A4U7KWK4_9BASI|nr:hypothetical protein EX895_001622 [Sporisorium graminicola]TKY89091.1 hypothetical protein EX895_001622 [Sporisorium graminicola]
MSFLPSFSSLAAPSTSTASSSSQLSFKPASLSYFTIFCPALKPPKKKRTQDTRHDDTSAAQEEAEDEDARETAREAAQILFYTSRARAALKDRMLRQIGVAKGMIEFCSMVSQPSGTTTTSRQVGSQAGGKGRSWNVHSSKRRMILVEVESGIWVHASIDLPYTTRAAADPRAKAAKEHHDALLPDVWLEESIRRAWRDWVLLNGCPAHLLSQKAGRAALERSLEKYFSVWAWSWDLELATNADVAQRGSLFTDCVEGFPVVPRAPRAKLMQLMQSDAVQRITRGKHGERDVVVLSETSLLWPPTNAGCFDSEDEDEGSDESGHPLKRSKLNAPKQDGASSSVDPQTKAELLRRVVSHLTGLERERDLIRAASASSTSDGRKRGTSGAIRERGSTSGNGKRDVRNGLLSAGAGTSNRRVVSSPIVQQQQQRATSASSVASSTTSEASKWSNWGSVFSGLGKLGFRSGADDSKAAGEDHVSGESEAADVLVITADLSGADTSIVDAAIPSSSSPIEAPVASKDASESDGAAEASSPLQLFQQRLADAIPIQEAGGKMWTGAEVAFRGISASLGLANASAPNAPQTSADALGTSTPLNLAKDGDASDRDRFADASFDTNGADADASMVTKVSILEPDVDVSELAEALGADEGVPDLSAANTVPLPDDPGADLVISEAIVEPDPQVKPKLKLDTEASAVETSSSRDATSPENETRASDAASIRTSASAKAFPSISVTSAAWYNTKMLRSDAAITTSSPKLAGATSIFPSTHEHKGTPEPFDTSLGGISVQSEHHDFELDGWGYEEPQPFQSFRCYVGESDVPLTHESVGLLQEQPFESVEYRVSFTTRRLLTMLLIERVTSTTGSTLGAQGSDTRGVLDDAWQVLRRLQRMLNDHARAGKGEQKQNDSSAVRFLHLDGATLTFQSSLDDASDAAAVNMEEEVQVVAEAHCVSAMELMRRHGVVETFSRSSNGKTWTASRLGKKTGGNANQTYMVLAGKKISIVDCDTELRKLANQYPSFGI